MDDSINADKRWVNFFCKTNEFVKEKEYRFAIIFSCGELFEPDNYTVKLKFRRPEEHYIKRIYLFDEDLKEKIKNDYFGEIKLIQKI